MKINIFFTIFFSTMSILLADPPNWEDDPGGYEFVATISGGIVLSDGVNMADEGDIFAAFDEDGNVNNFEVFDQRNFTEIAFSNKKTTITREAYGISDQIYDAFTRGTN